MQVETQERGTEERLADADRRLLEAEERLKQAELAAFSGTPLMGEDPAPEESPDTPVTGPAVSPWAVDTGEARPVRVAPMPPTPANWRGERRLGGPLPWVAALVAVMGIIAVLATTSSDDGGTDRVVNQSSNDTPAIPAAGAGDTRSAKPAEGSKKPSGGKASARSRRANRRARARRGAPVAARPGPAATAPTASTPAAAPRPAPVATRPAPSRPSPSRPAAPPQEPSVNIPSGGGGSSPSPSGDPAGRLPSP